MINLVYSKQIRASKMLIVDDLFIIILIALEKYVVFKFLLFKILWFEVYNFKCLFYAHKLIN